MTFRFGIALGVMLSVGIADMAWALYIKAVADAKRLNASWWSAVIVGLSSVTVLAYIANPVYLVPAVAGAFFGTFFSIKETK